MPLAAPVTSATCAFEIVDWVHLYIHFLLHDSTSSLRVAPRRKISFDAFNADGDRTGPIKNRNVIGYSAKQDNPRLRDTAVAIVDDEVIGAPESQRAGREIELAVDCGKGEGRLPVFS